MAVRCPFCDQLIQEEFVVCPHCTETLTVLCSNCKQKLEPGWVICANCGEDLLSSPIAPELKDLKNRFITKGHELMAETQKSIKSGRIFKAKALLNKIKQLGVDDPSLNEELLDAETNITASSKKQLGRYAVVAILATILLIIIVSGGLFGAKVIKQKSDERKLADFYLTAIAKNKTAVDSVNTVSSEEKNSSLMTSLIQAQVDLETLSKAVESAKYSSDKTAEKKALMTLISENGYYLAQIAKLTLVDTPESRYDFKTNLQQAIYTRNRLKDEYGKLEKRYPYISDRGTTKMELADPEKIAKKLKPKSLEMQATFDVDAYKQMKKLAYITIFRPTYLPAGFHIAKVAGLDQTGNTNRGFYVWYMNDEGKQIFYELGIPPISDRPEIPAEDKAQRIGSYSYTMPAADSATIYATQQNGFYIRWGQYTSYTLKSQDISSEELIKMAKSIEVINAN